MSHGLVEPLQKEHERIVRLLRLCSDLSGQYQGSQGDQSPADCSLSVDHGLVGERREIHDTLPPDPIPRFGWSRAAIAARKEG